MKGVYVSFTISMEIPPKEGRFLVNKNNINHIQRIDCAESLKLTIIFIINPTIIFLLSKEVHA